MRRVQTERPQVQTHDIHSMVFSTFFSNCIVTFCHFTAPDTSAGLSDEDFAKLPPLEENSKARTSC